jgi:hypothetical protein
MSQWLYGRVFFQITVDIKKHSSIFRIFTGLLSKTHHQQNPQHCDQQNSTW